MDMEFIMTEKFENPWNIIASKYSLFNSAKLMSKKIDALKQIEEEFSTVSTIPSLFCLLLSDEPNPIKMKICEAINNLFSEMMIKNKNIISFELSYEFRDIYIDINQIEYLGNFSSPNIFLGIASFNGNGYVREAVIDYWLSTDTDLSSLIPFILLRLNDHVDVIRTKAHVLFKGIMTSSNPNDIISYANALSHYAQFINPENEIFSDAIYQCLQKIEIHELLNSLKKWSPHEQIFMLNNVLSEIKTKQEFIKLVLENTLPSVKQWFSIRVQSWEFPDFVIKILLSDSSSFIKRLGLRKIKAESLDIYKEEIMMLICNESRRVRQSARFLMRGEEKDILHDNYCNIIDTSEKPPIGAILGFIEISTIEDLDQLKTYLTHSNKFVRAAALENLYRLIGTEANQWTSQGLSDHSSLVRMIAASIRKKSGAIYGNKGDESLLFKPMSEWNKPNK